MGIFNKGTGKPQRTITSFKGTPQKRSTSETTREARQKTVNILYGKGRTKRS